jgi:hypothetical protein
MKLIGYIVDEGTSEAVTQAIRDAQESRGLPVFWLLDGVMIYSGEHAGMRFVPADDEILSTPLRGNPVLTPRDFPEFNTIIELLGGLNARQEIDPSVIIPLIDP